MHCLTRMVNTGRVLGLVTCKVALLAAGLAQLVSHVRGVRAGVVLPELMDALLAAAPVTSHW